MLCGVSCGFIYPLASLKALRLLQMRSNITNKVQTINTHSDQSCSGLNNEFHLEDYSPPWS